MPDPRFYKKAGSFKIKELAETINARIINASGTEIIEDIATISTGNNTNIGFFHKPIYSKVARYTNVLKESKIRACIIAEPYPSLAPTSMILLVTANAYEAFAKIATKFYPNHFVQSYYSLHKSVKPLFKKGKNVVINEYVTLGENVIIGDNSIIGPNCVIGDNVIIGDNCIISSNVTITHAIIGDNCVFNPGVRIGQDGFGFAPSNTGITKIPQLGRVIISNNVVIGANSCVDRGSMEDTIIGIGTKIDNLVQISHNCNIGNYCLISGQVGLAGSTKIGNGVMVGGQAGFAGHLSIGDGSMIAAQSGVIKSIPPKSVVGGYPAMPIRDWHKTTSLLKKLINKINVG